MKKGCLITIIILLVSIYLGFKIISSVNAAEPSYKTEITKFNNARWVSTIDSLPGVEIKNGKWIFFYKETAVDSSNIYNYQIQPFYEKVSSEIIFENLNLTNATDTLNYTLLEYSKEVLSLRNKSSRKATLNFVPENAQN